jgi:hypothetical protein
VIFSAFEVNQIQVNLVVEHIYPPWLAELLLAQLPTIQLHCSIEIFLLLEHLKHSIDPQLQTVVDATAKHLLPFGLEERKSRTSIDIYYPLFEIVLLLRFEDLKVLVLACEAETQLSLVTKTKDIDFALAC